MSRSHSIYHIVHVTFMVTKQMNSGKATKIRAINQLLDQVKKLVLFDEIVVTKIIELLFQIQEEITIKLFSTNEISRIFTCEQ